MTFFQVGVTKADTAPQVLFRKQAKPVSTLSDEELVAELQRSMDADRFGLLYDRYAAKVFQKCVGMTRDKELAKDLSHDIFMKAFLGLAKFDHRAKFGTWLYSITYNYCLDYLRKNQRQRTESAEEDLEAEDLTEDRSEQELLSLRADRLSPVLEAMDPTDRAALLMKYQDELSIKDMMDILGLSESAVKMRVLRARERALAKYHLLFQDEP